MDEMLKENDVLKGMSMLDKVARFFVLIGEESTVKIFHHLPKDIVESISTAITQVSSINKDVSLAILEEFHLYTRSKSFISSGGYDFARDILYKSLGKNEADEVLAKLSRMKLASQAFSYLDGINPKQLSDFIKEESPHTIAVILSHMEPNKASEVLMQLDEEIRVKVTIQIATIKDVSPDVVRTISLVLEKKLESLLSSIVDVGGVKVVADMLNKLGPKAQDILIAMKNATEEDVEKVTSAMSQRGKDRFREETEMLSKVKIKDIEAAQRKMLDVAQKMIEDGIIDRENN